jgi:hypothetical protein
MRGPARVAVALLTVLACERLGPTPAARADAYHVEVVASDLTSDALFVTGLLNLDPHGAGATLLVASGTFYLLGAPVVHVAHGDGGIALASVGLRVGSLLPVGVGLLVADARARRAGGYDHSDDATIFFLGGAVSVLAIVAVQIIDPVLLTPDADADGAPTPLVMPLLGGTF